MQVCQALSFANQKGIDKLDAELLLLAAIGKAESERAWLFAHDDALLSAQQIQEFTATISARSQGLPVAYIIGAQEFWGMHFEVNSNVLIPRADTETIVRWALELDLPSDAKVLDLGTGSGAIACALKKERPNWHLHASDVSADALLVARSNARNLGLEINFEHSHWFSSIAPALFDLIVCNPPYIAENDTHLPALINEPTMALVSGTEGLDAISEITEIAPAFLKDNAYLLLEHGFDQSQAVQRLLRQQGFGQISQRLDYAGHVRCSGGKSCLYT